MGVFAFRELQDGRQGANSRTLNEGVSTCMLSVTRVTKPLHIAKTL